jgi:alkanesulfonate monooxygenase SsuD/methylene tetrahydromethanopterin reductase-like flavin-dependent oxidoreductase (luciferase family)
MRIGVAFSPTDDWEGVLAGARAADELGLDCVGFWDHYHSEQPDWGYIAGWAAHAWLAAVTTRIRIVPMVLCNLNHELGQLAKESSMLAIASGGRFELAIGAGDYPVEYRAWGRPFPSREERVDRLDETVAALRELWTGQPVSRAGAHVRLDGAICVPRPVDPPRVVVGAGGSRRLIDRAVAYADELNVYADAPAIIDHTRERIAVAGRPVALSGYRGLDWDGWPDDVAETFRPMADAGMDRLIVNVGYGWDKVARVRDLAEAQDRLRAT